MRLELPTPCWVAMLSARSMAKWNECTRQHQGRMPQLRNGGAPGETQEALGRRARRVPMPEDFSDCFRHACLSEQLFRGMPNKAGVLFTRQRW